MRTNHHRILLGVSAVFLMAVGLFQVVQGVTRVRRRALLEKDAFVHAYYPGKEGERYEKLFDETVKLYGCYGELRVGYFVMTGVFAWVIAFLIIMALAETRPRRPKPNAGNTAAK
jgi:hypothetical protein